MRAAQKPRRISDGWKLPLTEHGIAFGLSPNAGFQ